MKKQFPFNSHTTALSPDGGTFYAAEGSGVRVWDMPTGAEKDPILSDLKAAQCLSISSRGLLAVSNWKGDVTLWDTKSGEWVQTLEPHFAWTPMIAFSGDGSKLVTASADQTICIYDIDADGKGTLRARLAGHEDEIWALAMAGDGHFFTGSRNGSTRLWKIPARDEPGFSGFHLNSAIEFEDENQSLIAWTKGKDKRAEGFYRINLATGDIGPMLELQVPEGVIPETGVHRPHFLNTKIAGGSRIAQGSKENKKEITIWNLRTGRQEIALSEAGHLPQNYRGQPFAFSPDGSLFATANETNVIRVWNCADWSHRDLVPEFPGRTELCFSADNRVLAALPPRGEGEGVAIEVASGRVLARFELPGAAPEMALSPDGRFLAIGSTDREIRLWDLEKGTKIHSLRGHVAGIRGLAFSPDGRTLATCGDQRLKLWNVETGSELMVLAHSVVEIGDPLFSADGKSLVTKSGDGFLRVWRAPSMNEIDTPESQE